MKKRVAAIAISFVLLLGTIFSNAAAEDALKGQKLDEWGILALYAAGCDLSDRSLDRVEDSNISTDYEAFVMGALALGMDVENEIAAIAKSQREDGKFADYTDGTGGELLNAHIWGIIALECAGYDEYDKRKAQEWLLDRQNEDGGFPVFTGMKESDGDITAMAVTALDLLDLEGAQKSKSESMDFIETNNEEKETAEGLAWEIFARRQAGLETGDELKARLDAFRLDDGSYKHLKTMDSGNYMATWHGLLAEAEFENRLTVFDSLKAQNSISDIDDNTEGCKSIMRLVGDGVLSGYPDGTFRPYSNVKRGEFVKMLAFAMRKENELANPNGFIDMQGHWASTYVSIAVGSGIFNGVSDQLFDPESGITGAQLAAVAVRVKGLEEEAKAHEGEHWHSGYVYTAWLHDLLYPGFVTDKQATRAQCAQLIDNLYY